jgi:hypothetical protein
MFQVVFRDGMSFEFISRNLLRTVITRFALLHVYARYVTFIIAIGVGRRLTYPSLFSHQRRHHNHCGSKFLVMM